MKIVPPSVTLVHATQNPEQVIERFGRTCYQSSSGNTEAFIRMIIERGHESVLEHAVAGFLVVTDRGVTHEIVRHRVGASYSQESTRYCNYSLIKGSFDGELSFIEPPITGEAREIWVAAMVAAEQQYKSMILSGVKAQIARSVLPNSLKSEIGITMNFRAWRHFLKLRTSVKAHPQMVEIANMLWDQLKIISPVCFESI